MNTNSLSEGQVVPYTNTRSRIKHASIIDFKEVDAGRVWFNGIDVDTKAKVWYPTHISLGMLIAEERTCPCCDKAIKFNYHLHTAQSGLLLYYTCTECKEKLVSIQGDDLAIAAP